MDNAKDRMGAAGTKNRGKQSPRIVHRLKIDRDSDLGIRDQIHTQLSNLISSGILRKGTKLPSCRMLANDLGVSVNSVLGAYSRLTDDGALCVRRQSFLEN